MTRVSPTVRRLGLWRSRVSYLKLDVEGTKERILEAAGAGLDRLRPLDLGIHGDLIPGRTGGQLEKRSFRAEEDWRHCASVVALWVGVA